MAVFSFSFFIELSLRHGTLWGKSLYSLWGCLTSPWRWSKYIQAIFPYWIREWAVRKIHLLFHSNVSLSRGGPELNGLADRHSCLPQPVPLLLPSEQLQPPFLLGTGWLPVPATVLAEGLEDGSRAWDPSLSVGSANKDTRKAFKNQSDCGGL